MAFVLGNFSIDEILYGTAQNSAEDLLYTLDQLSTASIEISAESTDITDKKGNVVRTVYTSKTGTFNATNAFLHPQIMNAASGSSIQEASSAAPIQMPKIEIVEAGKGLNVADAVEGTIRVIGIYGNGANSAPMTSAEVEAAISDNVLTVPVHTTDADPIQYLVKYERNVESGIKLTNEANAFPNLVKLTLFCSYVD